MPIQLETIVIDPLAAAGAAIIWLHGLGADGHDFEGIVPALRLPTHHEVRFIFPHAPVRPITINGGMAMRAWYDIVDTELRQTEDEPGIRESATAVRALVDAQVAAGIPPERIVLAGFSQGGAIALHLGLRYPQPLAGIMALSTYLPLAATLPEELAEANRSVSIFMAHGTEDPLVLERFGRNSADALRSFGYDVDYRTYRIPHSVSPAEVADIATWLKVRLQID